MKACFVCALTTLLAGQALAAEPNLGFKPAQESGYFQFDTGTVRGKIQLTGKFQGIPELVFVPANVEVAMGGRLPGLFSFYRALSTNKRYDAAVRDWPTASKVLPDGALEVSFPPAEDHPLQITAIHRWVRPDTLDVVITVKPQQDMLQFELFMSNYFPPGFQSLVYVKPGNHSRGKPSFVPADWSPPVDGTYLYFPRDRQVGLMIFDGRWDYPPNPVQWSVVRYLAAPVAMRRDPKSGIAALMMSPPEDSFAIATPYNRTPPDGVAGHNSLYQSLIGRDLAAGETAHARIRLVVGPITDEKAVELYEQYLKEPKQP